MILNYSSTRQARIKHQQLLAQTVRRATFSFLEKVQVKAGSSALCLNCGEGDVAFQLSGLIGENGTVRGIDPNRENVHTAEQLSRIKSRANTSFCLPLQNGEGKDQQFEMIHCRLPLLGYFDPVFLVEGINAQLIPGGIALLEVVDFSGFNGIPKNFAFERFLDLYTTVIRSQWGEIPFTRTLSQVLSQTGFHPVQQQYIAPQILHGPSRQLPSLTLESIQEEVLKLKLVAEDEFQVLLWELKGFEKKSDSLIIFPGIHQIWGQTT